MKTSIKSIKAYLLSFAKDAVKMFGILIMLFCMFFIAGTGFYLGVLESMDMHSIFGKKAIVITIVDLTPR